MTCMCLPVMIVCGFIITDSGDNKAYFSSLVFCVSRYNTLCTELSQHDYLGLQCTLLSIYIYIL